MNRGIFLIKMKINKLITIIIIVLALTAIAFWAPFERYDLSISGLFGVQKTDQYSGLQVVSLKDSLGVYIDGDKKGEILPEEGTFEITDINPGTHVVRLEKIGDDSSSSYFEYVRSVDFLDAYSVVLAYELGPSAEFSQGHILYAQRTTNEVEDGKTRLNIDVVNTTAEVFLNGSSIGSTPIQNYELSLSSIHEIRLAQKGYEELEFSILSDSQVDREKLKEVDLFLEARLFLIPILLD
jgi:hypothetical protein